MPVDAMLLSAGFGTRLRPLTNDIPKPLVMLEGKTLIERNLEVLRSIGVRRVFINLHYLGDQIRDYVGDGKPWDLAVEYSEEPELLDTGGGIAKIAALVKTPHLLTINSDVFIAERHPVKELVETHISDESKPLSTMMLREDAQSEAFGEIVINESREVIRFLDVESPSHGPASKSETLMFAGIQVLSADLLAKMPKDNSKFSITRDTLRNEVANGGLIRGIKYQGFWSDIGTPDRLEIASKYLASR